MSLLPKRLTQLSSQLKKNDLLQLSALLIWSLVSYISLKNLTISVELTSAFIWKSIALVSFIVLFFNNISPKSFLKFSLSLTAQVVLVLTLIYFDKYQIIPILLVLIATQLPAHFSRLQGIFIILSINACYYFVLITAQPEQSIFTVLIFIILQIFGFSTIEITLREQHAREKLSAINQELIATRFMLKESTKKQERLRISRDLHDVLGHQLTALALNLEITSHKVPDEHKSAAKDNLKQAKQLLDDVRNVVKEMRNEEQFDLITSIKRLFQQLPNCQFSVIPDKHNAGNNAGNNAENHAEDKVKNTELAIHSLTLKNQLFHCLQEGISNALRHGHANAFNLSFSKKDDLITLDLQDNGSGTSTSINTNRFGSGLLGMNERLKDFNGTVELINTPQGCLLRIQVTDSYD